MKKLIPQLIFLLFSVALQAQVQIERNVLASSGDQMTNGNLSLDWTLGEIMTESYTQAGVVICQGFHQGNQLSVATSEIELPYRFSIYPNPTIDLLFITAETTDELQASLIDLSGKVINTIALDTPAQSNQISLANLPNAIYLLKVEDKQGRSNIFKISKKQ